MKKTFIILTTFLMSFATTSDEPIERIGVKGPLTFNQTEFDLRWTSQPSESYYIQEYLPKGESVSQFTQMLSLFLLVRDTKLKSAVQQKIKELDNQKKSDPRAITW